MKNCPGEKLQFRSGGKVVLEKNTISFRGKNYSLRKNYPENGKNIKIWLIKIRPKRGVPIGRRGVPNGRKRKDKDGRVTRCL